MYTLRAQHVLQVWGWKPPEVSGRMRTPSFLFQAPMPHQYETVANPAFCAAGRLLHVDHTQRTSQVSCDPTDSVFTALAPFCSRRQTQLLSRGQSGYNGLKGSLSRGRWPPCKRAAPSEDVFSTEHSSGSSPFSIFIIPMTGSWPPVFVGMFF